MYEAFRDTCLKHYKLDPVYFYTSPGRACLKCTGIKLELLTDPDMLLMFEQGIRGGITQAVHKYAAANNKYMGDRFDGRMEINGVEKLVPNLRDKKSYVIHIQALNQALQHGLRLDRIHRAIEFDQSP